VERAIAAVLLATAWVATWRPAVDPDQWWHLVLGREIRAAGAIPGVESLSWWTAGDPLFAHSWAWDLLLSLAHELAGLTGISLLGAAISGLVISLLWWLTRVTSDLGPVGRAVVVLAAVLAALPLWGARAQLWDVAAVAALALVWTRWLRTGDPRSLVVVPLVTVLWANLHGSAILAYPACLVALALAVPLGIRWGTWPRRPVRPLVVAAAIGALALLATPFGPSLLLYPFDPAVASAGNEALDEWRAPAFGDPALLGFLVAIVSMVAGLVPATRPRDPLLVLLAVGWTLAALTAVRFALVAGPLLVVAFAPPVLGAVRSRWPVREPPGPTRRGPAAALGAVATAVVVLILAIGVTYVEPATQQRLAASRYPVAMLERLGGACAGRLLNAYDWGGYLSWTTERAVGAYGNSPGHVVTTQAALETLTVDPPAILADLGVDVALVKTGSPLRRWFAIAPGWILIASDPVASVYARPHQPDCQRL
jgi:hypothetical protein